MSKYNGLNARSELEQAISKDLEDALKKRGFNVKHNGTKNKHAPAGFPDIEVYDSKYHINVEVTTRVKSSAEGEFISIKTHLEDIKSKNYKKKCFAIYVSPETHYRMISAIKDYNTLNNSSKDLKIIPICFSTFELLMIKLIESPNELYKKHNIIALFEHHKDFINDDRILKIVSDNLFPNDNKLTSEIKIKEENAHQKMVKELIVDLIKFENDLRKNGIATHDEAIKNVIYLVFMKLYEEKREYEGEVNRFSRIGFSNYQQIEGNNDNCVHSLFEKIKNDEELKNTKTLTEFDRLAEKINDSFVIKYFIIPFEKYYFYTTKVDGLGAAYEVLGQLSGKDVKAGQFFTPENIVRTMIKIVELTKDDLVLDPACGTARFLIYAMYDMIDKVSGTNKEKQKIKIRKEQLYGSDFDSYVSKLAKMNMYIHQDGKTNIQDKDGLLLKEYDGKATVILTNPPLGNLSYWLVDYDDDFRINRMDIIPKKDGKVTGQETKGGGLFINACSHYLKDIVDDDAPPEWKGGKLAIILDESILNVDEYDRVRRFIKSNFYIKAVISLTKDTFVPVSKTSNKTSILYAIKKKDKKAIQTEPIFYAYVDKVGINTKRKVCDNHLFNDEEKDLLSSYFNYKNAVKNSYDDNHFNLRKLKEKIKIGEKIEIKGNSYYFIREFSDINSFDGINENERIDCRYYDPKFDEIKKYMTSDKVKSLRSVVVGDNFEYGLTATGLEAGDIAFINIENLTENGNINKDNIRYVKEAPKSKLLQEGDLLISRSRLVGLASIITKEEEGYTFGSYIIKFKLNNEVIPLFVAKFLNSTKGKLQTELLKTGATGENINSQQLLRVVIPRLSKEEQKDIIDEIGKIELESIELQKMAMEKMNKAKSKLVELVEKKTISNLI